MLRIVFTEGKVGEFSIENTRKTPSEFICILSLILYDAFFQNSFQNDPKTPKMMDALFFTGIEAKMKSYFFLAKVELHRKL